MEEVDLLHQLFFLFQIDFKKLLTFWQPYHRRGWFVLLSVIAELRRAVVVLCVFFASSHTYGGGTSPDVLHWLCSLQGSCSQSFSRSNPVTNTVWG